jgi:hypothetical protein
VVTWLRGQTFLCGLLSDMVLSLLAVHFQLDDLAILQVAESLPTRPGDRDQVQFFSTHSSYSPQFLCACARLSPSGSSGSVRRRSRARLARPSRQRRYT